VVHGSVVSIAKFATRDNVELLVALPKLTTDMCDRSE
jgi:hypothetical protein